MFELCAQFLSTPLPYPERIRTSAALLAAEESSAAIGLPPITHPQSLLQSIHHLPLPLLAAINFSCAKKLLSLTLEMLLLSVILSLDF